MDIKELSVGSLLKWKEQEWFTDKDRATVLEVTNIYLNPCRISIKGRNEIYVLSLFEPIPLTAEILEKNGFKFLIEDEKYKTLCLNEPYISCTFVKEFKDWMITAGACGSVKKRFVEVSKVQFVHEMQNILRLCRYELDLKL